MDSIHGESPIPLAKPARLHALAHHQAATRLRQRGNQLVEEDHGGFLAVQLVSLKAGEYLWNIMVNIYGISW